MTERILIIVSGGVVQDVLSSTPEIDIALIDTDDLAAELEGFSGDAEGRVDDIVNTHASDYKHNVGFERVHADDTEGGEHD